ncbi:hypothetical protein [Streptomyces sp. NPDC052107]|uniref:hypothetical protein n=1 Tax=Streptomyces sp. NPDC052107 TaxID=3155632 RepID=UPI003415A0B6
MRDLRWEDVSGWFDCEEMGALPDLRVPGTSAEDWQALLGLVVANGRRHEYLEGAAVRPLPRAAHVLGRPLGAECPQLRVWPVPGMLAVSRFLGAEEVDFDVDLREIQGQERLDLFCGFLRSVGRHLRRPVLMDPEGASLGEWRRWTGLPFGTAADAPGALVPVRCEPERGYAVYVEPDVWMRHPL